MSNAIETLIATVKAKPDLSPETIRAMIRRCFQRCLIAVEADLQRIAAPGIDKGETLAEMQADLANFRSYLAKANLPAWVAIEMVATTQDAGVRLDELSASDHGHLKEGVLRANIESARIAIARLSGATDQLVPKDPLFSGIDTWGMSRSKLEPLPQVQTNQPQAETLTLTGAIERYVDLKKQNGAWVHKTLWDNMRVLKLFLDLTGPKPIRSVVNDDVRAFRDALLKVPSSFMKAKANAEKPLSEIIKNAGGLKTLAPRTASKYFHNLRAFLKWCNDEGYIDAVPGGSIKIAGASKADAKNARYPFNDTQLVQFFESPQYSGHLSETARAKPGQKRIKDGKYWIPLIALFSGMRLGEIVQLLVTDIKSEGAVWYFDIARNEGETKQLKTGSSQRKIPIHPVLIKLGILDHVEARRGKDAKGRLFPDIEQGKDGYFSHNFSKWFGRYLKQVQVKTLKTSFHSFRHNFKDALEMAGVEESRRRVLMGHSDGSVHAAYGSRVPVVSLALDLNKIAYPVDFSGLYLPASEKLAS